MQNVSLSSSLGPRHPVQGTALCPRNKLLTIAAREKIQVETVQRHVTQVESITISLMMMSQLWYKDIE